jgi:hypothetical protein
MPARVCNGSGGIADACDIDLRFAPLLDVGPGPPDIFRFQLGVADDSGNMFSGVSLPTDTNFVL